MIQLILVVWLVSLVPVGAGWLVLAVLALVYGLFLLLSPLRSFALFVAVVLGQAFYAIAEGSKFGWDIKEQFQWIVLQLVVLGIAGASWAQATELRKWARLYDEAQRQLATLRKTDRAVSVLSANEFKDRLKAIVVSLRRRNEPGAVILVSVPPRVVGFGGRHYTPEAVLQWIGETALASVRDQFDIVGRISRSTLAIVLQRCDREGASRALRRFHRQLLQKRRLRAEVVMSWVHVEELPVIQGWTAVEAMLEEAGADEAVAVRRKGG